MPGSLDGTRSRRYPPIRKFGDLAEKTWVKSEAVAIYHPDMERETYYHAVADPAWGTDARSSLKAAVVEKLDQGAGREHVLEVLDGLADELGAGGHADLEDAVLDVMDALTGWVHSSKRF